MVRETPPPVSHPVLFFCRFIIVFKPLSVGPDVVVEYSGFQAGHMIYRHDGLFRGIHATDRGAIIPAHGNIPGTHTLDPGYLLRFLPVRWTVHMTLIGARCRKDAFKLHAGDYIVKAPRAV